MEYSYNKTYTFEVNASFGDLPKETIDVMFRDGRVAHEFAALSAQINVADICIAWSYDATRMYTLRV